MRRRLFSHFVIVHIIRERRLRWVCFSSLEYSQGDLVNINQTEVFAMSRYQISPSLNCHNDDLIMVDVLFKQTKMV